MYSNLTNLAKIMWQIIIFILMVWKEIDFIAKKITYQFAKSNSPTIKNPVHSWQYIVKNINEQKIYTIHPWMGNNACKVFYSQCS